MSLLDISTVHCYLCELIQYIIVYIEDNKFLCKYGCVFIIFIF